jgi:anti-sigma regulatory factor (Ser/Thr protein kinase)
MHVDDEVEAVRSMAADPDGSSIAVVGPGPAREARRAAPAIRELWHGPGWRVFDASADQGRHVRDWITRVIGRHGCLAHPSDAALVVSELFTNAVMHGPAGGRVLVGYCLWRDGVQIVVCDAGGTTSPWLRKPGELDEGGRGLQVVDAVAAAWGTFRAGHALAVWCDLGKPLEFTSEAQAWLRPVLAATSLAAPAWADAKRHQA